MKPNKINDGHYLELMDRLHVVMSTIDDHILSHPLTKEHKDVRFQVQYALGQLWDAYQLVGQKEIEKNDEKDPIQKVVLRRRKKSSK